jgi:hypothetical protein
VECHGAIRDVWLLLGWKRNGSTGLSYIYNST